MRQRGAIALGSRLAYAYDRQDSLVRQQHILAQIHDFTLFHQGDVHTASSGAHPAGDLENRG